MPAIQSLTGNPDGGFTIVDERGTQTFQPSPALSAAQVTAAFAAYTLAHPADYTVSLVVLSTNPLRAKIRVTQPLGIVLADIVVVGS